MWLWPVWLLRVAANSVLDTKTKQIKTPRKLRVPIISTFNLTVVTMAQTVFCISRRPKETRLFLMSEFFGIPTHGPAKT
jgi:hypothetical protein